LQGGSQEFESPQLHILADNTMNLAEVIEDVADSLIAIDTSRVPFRSFQLGVGPYGEPQLLKAIALNLNRLPKYNDQVQTRRTPDLLIPKHWAIEFKIARPYGDNGKEAENWSVNLLHPYKENVSTIGDCYKLLELASTERKAVVVIGYEHSPARIDLTPLIEAFEVVAKQVMHIALSDRIETRRNGLIHPVHQSVRVFAWELI
jgi:hypothetical protein